MAFFIKIDPSRKESKEMPLRRLGSKDQRLNYQLFQTSDYLCFLPLWPNYTFRSGLKI